MGAHLSSAALEDFLHGRGAPVFDREALTHLLRGCRQCARVVDRAMSPPTLALVQAPDLDAAAARAMDAFLERRLDGSAADALVAELDGLPRERALTLVRNAPRFRRPEFVDRLLAASKESLGVDIERAVLLAELAVAAARSLEGDDALACLAPDLRCLAMVELANALRRRGEFREAGKRLLAAFALLEDAASDPLTRARALETRAFLNSDQGRYREALADLRSVTRLYRSLRDLHRCGTTLVRQAQVLEELGEPERAIPLLHQACAFVDTGYQPRWALVIYHNLAVCHAGAGRAQDALAYLSDAEPFYRDLGKPADLLRLRWTEGRILAETEDLESAESRFREAAHGFARLGLPYEAAEVSLELALVLAERGRVEELARVAAEMLPIFRSRELHREAIAALAFLTQAVEAGTVTARVVRHVSRFVEGVRSDASLVFQPGS